MPSTQSNAKVMATAYVSRFKVVVVAWPIGVVALDQSTLKEDNAGHTWPGFNGLDACGLSLCRG